MELRDRLIVPPDKPLTLADWDPDETLGFEKEAAVEKTEKAIARLDELQYLMYAEHRRALLVVLQGMDGAGKDGTIRHVMRGLNPEVAIFNRSHYEDVLAAGVRKLVPKNVWTRRYDHINGFEQLLTDSSVVVVKFFLHISKDEQRRRFEERLRDPTKQWKLSPSDFEDRKRCDDYVAAYEDVLTRCSTSDAPWLIVPADKKWFRNFAVSRILVEALEALDMRFPKPTVDVSRITPSLSSGRGR